MVTKRKRQWVRCDYCDAEVRKATVLVGRPEREAVLLIDRWPHPDGEVIRRTTDNRWRMLRPGRIARDGIAAFRVHSRRSCGPDQSRVEGRRKTVTR